MSRFPYIDHLTLAEVSERDRLKAERGRCHADGRLMDYRAERRLVDLLNRSVKSDKPKNPPPAAA